jgi:hypothetical protein
MITSEVAGSSACAVGDRVLGFCEAIGCCWSDCNHCWRAATGCMEVSNIRDYLLPLLSFPFGFSGTVFGFWG